MVEWLVHISCLKLNLMLHVFVHFGLSLEKNGRMREFFNIKYNTMQYLNDPSQII